MKRIGLLLWLALPLAAQPVLRLEGQAAADGPPGLVRLKLTCHNGRSTSQQLDFPAGTAFVSPQGSSLYVCQPITLKVAPGQAVEQEVRAVSAGPPAGRYELGDPEEVPGASLFVGRQAASGPSRWAELAAVLQGGGDPNLRQQLANCQLEGRARKARRQAQRALLRKDYTRAVAYLSEAIASQPTGLDFRLRAEAQQRLGQYSLALADAEMALSHNPHDIEALLRHAYSKIYLKAYADALLDLNRVLARDPKQARAYRYRAYVREQLQQSGVQEDYDRSLKLNPFDAPTYYYRSQYLERQGQRDQALSDVEQAVALDSSNSGYLGWRGHLLGLQGNIQQALPDLRRALQLNPSNSQAQEDLRKWGGNP
jgi:tetratricopeptide (TPR) repeat protein